MFVSAFYCSNQINCKKRCEVLTKLGSNKSISFIDMRTELEKLEAQYKKLRTENENVESEFPSSENAE